MCFPRIVRHLIWVVVAAFPLFAQSPNGNINGLVSDPATGAIVGAEIVAVNGVSPGIPLPCPPHPAAREPRRDRAWCQQRGPFARHYSPDKAALIGKGRGLALRSPSLV